jgi:hypothetical protein
MNGERTMLARLFVLTMMLCADGYAQTIQPVISEFTGKASGRMAVTNNSAQSMVVLLEPRSFSLDENGKGRVRSLDSGIHVHLSNSSVKLAPGQTGYVFYEATADMLPAWFTLYATFTSPRHGDSLDVRIMLPHTVYLHQKEPMRLPDVAVENARFDAGGEKVVMDVHNVGTGLGRVQAVRVVGGKDSADAASFPLLPGMTRHVEIPWSGRVAPEELNLRFEHFKVASPVLH